MDTPEAFYHYFMGLVEDVNEEGILIRNPNTGCKRFFFKSQVVALAEEEVLSEDKPKDAEILAKFKDYRAVGQGATPKEPYVDPKQMSELINLAKTVS
jgi:hypothetical protein